MFNFLPQRRRKLSTCPHVLNFLARALSFLLPKVDMCFCAHASGNQLDSIQTPAFQKSRPAFFKTTLSLTIHKKKQFELLLSHARFACHFPLQFRKTIGSQSEAGNQVGDVLHAEEFKKKKKNMHPIKNSLLLVKNVSCSSTDPKSTDVPPSL